MKRIVIGIVCALSVLTADTQPPNVERLRAALDQSKGDLGRFNALTELYYAYLWSNPDSSFPYIKEASIIVHRLHSDIITSEWLQNYSWLYILTGDYVQAQKVLGESFNLAAKVNDWKIMSTAQELLGVVYDGEQDPAGLMYHKVAKSIYESNWKPTGNNVSTDTLVDYVRSSFGLASSLRQNNNLDSAMFYLRYMDSLYQIFNIPKWSPISYEFGNVYALKRDFSFAYKNYNSGIVEAKRDNNQKDLIDNYNGMALALREDAKIDSSIYYANLALGISNSAKFFLSELTALGLLANIYQRTNKADSLIKFLQLEIAARDSLLTRQKVFQLQGLEFDEQKQSFDLGEQRRQSISETRTYILIAGTAVLLLIAIILYRINILKQKVSTLLQKQKQEAD